MFNINIGDKLIIEEVKPKGFKARNAVVGEVVAEHEHHFSLKSRNYVFSITKNAIFDNSLKINRVKNASRR